MTDDIPLTHEDIAEIAAPAQMEQPVVVQQIGPVGPKLRFWPG